MVYIAYMVYIIFMVNKVHTVCTGHVRHVQQRDAATGAVHALEPGGAPGGGGGKPDAACRHQPAARLQPPGVHVGQMLYPHRFVGHRGAGDGLDGGRGWGSAGHAKILKFCRPSDCKGSDTGLGPSEGPHCTDPRPLVSSPDCLS